MQYGNLCYLCLIYLFFSVAQAGEVPQYTCCITGGVAEEIFVWVLLSQSSGLVGGVVRGVGGAAGLVRHGAAGLGHALAAVLRAAQRLPASLAHQEGVPEPVVGQQQARLKTCYEHGHKTSEGMCMDLLAVLPCKWALPLMCRSRRWTLQPQQRSRRCPLPQLPLRRRPGRPSG